MKDEMETKMSKSNQISPERIWIHHRTLCREIGPRLLGTENDKRAAEYIETHFSRCGLVTSSQRFQCPSWDHWGTSIYTSSGYKISQPEGGALMFSVPCDVTGELVNVKTIDELKKADIQGKICVISDELRSAPIREDRNPILLLIEEKSPLAVIIVGTFENGYHTKTIRDPKFKVPVCAVSKNSGARLLEDGGVVTVKIKSQRYESYSRNIFASTTKVKCKKIRFMAHYDTASDTPGAVDNGSGISILLEVAEAVKESGIDIPIEFIAFGGEEYAGKGSHEYMVAFPEEIDNTYIAINIDGVGDCNSEPRIYVSGENKELYTSVSTQASIVGGYHELIFDEMSISSDHKMFYRKGIPTVFANDKPKLRLWDTNLDIPRYMCLERLEDVAKIIFGIIKEMGSSLPK